MGHRYDRKFGVETTNRVAATDLDIDMQRMTHAIGYVATGPVIFSMILSDLNLAYGEYRLVDFGSGKGRALLVASEFPFREIVGVELSQRLHHTAEANIARYRSRTQQCRAIRSVCTDATSFVLPYGPTVFYFFNPFNEQVLATVLDNISESIRENPRHIVIIYSQPVHRNVFDRVSFLVNVTPSQSDSDYIIYESNNRYGRELHTGEKQHGGQAERFLLQAMSLHEGIRYAWRMLGEVFAGAQGTGGLLDIAHGVVSRVTIGA